MAERRTGSRRFITGGRQGPELRGSSGSGAQNELTLAIFGLQPRRSKMDMQSLTPSASGRDQRPGGYGTGELPDHVYRMILGILL